MARIYVGIGSNIEPHRHIAAALDRLTEIFGRLTVSPVYESEAIGFAGAPFLNLVVSWDSELPVVEITALLRQIECDNGYAGGAPKFSSRSLDLDLLLYGTLHGTIDGVELPRTDITAYAYALWPLADIAGAQLHPVLNESFAELRRHFPHGQQLHPISFLWRGRDLSATARRCAG